MKNFFAIPAIFTILLGAALWVSSCKDNPSSTVDPAASATKSQEAYTEMENIFSSPGSLEDKDFTSAEQLFTQAVELDPANPTANFGAAFTRMLSINADTTIKNMLLRWQDFGSGNSSSMFKFGIPSGTQDMLVPTAMLGKNLLKIMQVATNDPPTIAEMQNIIRSRVLPRIDYAIARLAVVEQNQNFELRISGKMQGNPSANDLYLDLTEVYVMDAVLHGLKALFEQTLVFKFDMNDYSTASIVDALQPTNTSFFVLAPDGRDRAHSVKNSLASVVLKIRSGVLFLLAETDDQNDDIIKKGTNGIAINDLTETLNALDEIETALNGTIAVNLVDADSDGNDYTIQINFNNFYSNLPQNPKQAWLPPYTVDATSEGDILWRWQAQTYDAFTFPDPTFSGLFPGMTNETLKRILHIDEAFAGI